MPLSGQTNTAVPTVALPPLQPPVRPASPSSSVDTSTGPRPAVPLDQHYNAPLRAHVWRSKSTRKPKRRSSWLKAREEFFDTRVTNRAEIWASLKAVVELLDQDDISTAQGIIDASEITLPTGDLVDGAYDKFGNLYQLPQSVVAAPSNIVEDEDATNQEKDIPTSSAYQTLDPRASEPGEKGKEAISSEERITVKARLSDRGGASQDVIVTMGKADSTQTLMNAVAAQAGVAQAKVRIAYMGKVLKANKGFVAQGWQTGHVVNALIAP